MRVGACPSAFGRLAGLFRCWREGTGRFGSAMWSILRPGAWTCPKETTRSSHGSFRQRGVVDPQTRSLDVPGRNRENVSTETGFWMMASKWLAYLDTRHRAPRFRGSVGQSRGGGRGRA